MFLVEGVPAKALRGVQKRHCNACRVGFSAVFRELHVVVRCGAEIHDSFRSGLNGDGIPVGDNLAVRIHPEPRVVAHAVVLGGAGADERGVLRGYVPGVGLVEGKPESQRTLFGCGEPECDNSCRVACESLAGVLYAAGGEFAGIQRFAEVKTAAVAGNILVRQVEI